MKKHPKKKHIINTALKTESINKGRRKFILAHIKDCNECTKQYEAIKSLLKPSNNISIIPSDNLEHRVLKS